MSEEPMSDKEVAHKVMKLKLELNIAEGMLRLATSHHKIVEAEFLEFQSGRDKMFMGWDKKDDR
jgi:hypothetical protein